MIGDTMEVELQDGTIERRLFFVGQIGFNPIGLKGDVRSWHRVPEHDRQNEVVIWRVGNDRPLIVRRPLS